jgi:hypothetical protein
MSTLLLSVDGPTGRVDLAVDGAAPLSELLPALAAAAGMQALGNCLLCDGARPLARADAPGPGGLEALGVVSGTVLRLMPAADGWRE